MLGYKIKNKKKKKSKILITTNALSIRILIYTNVFNTVDVLDSICRLVMSVSMFIDINENAYILQLATYKSLIK